jgi:type IV pilus assembly protein PilY1
MKTRSRASQLARKTLACAIALSMLGTDLAFAANDLSDVPLASSATATVRPNILYVLDDSGSMDEDAMPDEMTDETSGISYRTHLCNTIYYNPNTNYVAPPQLANGTRFPDQSFTGARSNGYNSSSGTTDLSSAFRAHGGDTSQPAYYYVLTAGAVSSPLSSACQSSPSASSSFPHENQTANGATWKKVRVTSTSGPSGTDERQNFANWYSYYRTRLMMMKAATGRAFVELSESYRVGFITINPNSPVSSGKYLRMAQYDETHKQAFLDKLYSQSTNGATPLREALSRAGWIYAGKLNTGLTNGIPAADDPIEYSCQQNFTILTTDGYWNGNRGQDLFGNAVGNQDANIDVSPRPMYDSGFSSTETTTTRTRSFFYSNCFGGRRRIRYNDAFQQEVKQYSGATLVNTATSNWTDNNNNLTNCVNNPPALPTPNPEVTVTGPTVSNNPSGGSTNSLADVAQYYYQTDLRSGMENNVPSSGTGVEDDKAPWQHMTTFTLGLGLFGVLQFHSDYKTNTQPGSTFNQIRSGAIDWPAPPDSTSISSDPEKADDMWHTAVNGRGQAFNATNPEEIVNGLNDALSGVNARVASAAAAATSNLEPVAGDNFAYTASYETVKWQGELQAREIDLQTGVVGTTPVWSAAAKLNAKTGEACDNRTIWLFRGGATNNLTPFTWNTDTCDASMNPAGSPTSGLNGTEQGFFDSTYADNLTQWTSMTDGIIPVLSVDQKTLAAGANLVNFVRGQRGKEGFISNNADGLYRERENILGDIVNAQPLFVRRPFAEYLDTGYKAYKTAQDNRTPMVYVAANDGMLHAFFAGTSASDPQGGVEAWAFIPTMVLPALHRLADEDYKSLHQFTVDGTPVAGDVFDTGSGTWKTIVVAGLNKGGTGYYALDVTDPTNPIGLWEFKHSTTCYDAGDSATHGADCNLGYSYGNPIISKLADGTWVVFVASGYNNVNGAANDGQGFLYVLNAMTGQIIKKIGTGLGDATTPSGLGKINNWVDSGLTDNTTQRVYGVDLSGNVWRFDVNSATPRVQLIATVKDANGDPQSITTKPELANIGYPPQPHIYVATGRYLGATDIADAQVQSLYAIRDPLTYGTPTTPIYADLRASGTLAEIDITNGTTNGVPSRTGACDANATCPQDDGWFADFPDTGERVNVDIRLQLGTLTVLSNVPQNTACNIGGYSYINFFDYATGLPVSTSVGGLVGIKLADSLAVGLNIVRLPSGKTVAISTTSDSSQRTSDVPISSPAITGRRVSWREIGE